MIDSISRLSRDQFVILLFHGVIPERRFAVRNYTQKHMTRDRFEAVLRELLALGTPVSMADVVKALRHQAVLPQRAFAVTFDDGFANNATVAAPILRQHGIPATFYLTTDFIDTNRMSWIDRIETAVEQAPEFSVDLPAMNYRKTVASPTEKIDFLDQVRRFVKNESHLNPYDFADEVCAQIGVTLMIPDPDLDQKMSWDQVRELKRDPLFIIGGHGHTHRILSHLSPLELESEVATSLSLLHMHVDGLIDHYSYPEGLAHCYSREVIDVLRRHGIVCAPTAMNGINTVGDDLFHLKRVMVV